MKYTVERDIQTIEQIDRVLLNLPHFCHAFFIGIEQTTSPLTRLGYARDLEIFFNYLIQETEKFNQYAVTDFEKEDLNKITIDDIELYLSFLTHYRKNENEHCNSDRGKMRKMASLRSFFKYFYRRGDLKENIMTKIDMPKIHEKSILRLTDEEVATMIAEASKNPRDEMIISLFLLSGIRVSELVGLDYQDIDLTNKTFLITRKGGKQTILHMGQQLHDKFVNYFALSEWTANTPLFTKCGRRLTVRAIENIVKKICCHCRTIKKN